MGGFPLLCRLVVEYRRLISSGGAFCPSSGYICVFNNISDFSTAGFYNYRQFSTFSTEKQAPPRAFRKKFRSFSAKHRCFIVFHSFHEFSTGKTPGNGGKPVFLWKRGTCRGAGPWLRLYLVYKRFIFAPGIAGCERWKNKSFQHWCGKRCGKSLEGRRSGCGRPVGTLPACAQARGHRSPSGATRHLPRIGGVCPVRGGFLCSLRPGIKPKSSCPHRSSCFFNRIV